MNRAYHSLTRIFKPSKPVVDDTDDTDDLAAVEKSFRSSSFALLPSTRACLDIIIASHWAAFFGAPVRYHIPFGWEKWPEVVNWHDKRGSNGSTAIDRIQLRKSRQHPYYHEYIVVSTTGGRTYRVDRRPDADAAFNTIMQRGCTAYDTIEEVGWLALKKLKGTSDCVVELQWQGKQTIDLLFVLSICFRIHNDRWTKRYTLQLYNCHFVSWTIVMIVVRNTVGWAAGSDAALEYGIWPERLRNWMIKLGLKRDWELELEQKCQQNLSGKPDWEMVRKRQRMQERDQEMECKLKQGRELERGRDQELELEQALVRARARVQSLEQERELVLERERERTQELVLVRELDLDLARALEQELTLALERARERGLERARDWARERALQRARKRDLKLQRAQEHAWEKARVWEQRQALVWEREQMLTTALTQIPLQLGCQLALTWKHREVDVQEKLRELVGDADNNFLLGELDALAKTVPGNTGWLSNGVGAVIVKMMEEPTEDICRALSSLAVLPDFFSVSLAHKPHSLDPKPYNVTPAQLEQHIVEAVENHAARVSRWQLGSTAEVKSDILFGMWRTWKNVSHPPMRIS